MVRIVQTSFGRLHSADRPKNGGFLRFLPLARAGAPPPPRPRGCGRGPPGQFSQVQRTDS
jgi:hypothetical protein